LTQSGIQNGRRIKMPFSEWSGHMDWPLDHDWKCEVCEATYLEWGVIHGLCRCTRCHAKYNMRDRDGKRVTKPKPLLKPRYKEAAKRGWAGLPLDEWIDDMWTAAMETAPNPGDYQQQIPEPPQEFEQDPMNPCGAIDPRF